ncbi:MAG: fatty acid desaturase family protein [Bacteroidia bacterium]
MAVEELKVVRFAPAGKDQFHDTVIARVKAYFSEKNISQYANTAMWVKTLIMLLLYFVPYFFMVAGFGAGRPWLFFSFWFIMSWGMSGIGTAVMHDAQHGAYSPEKWVNKYIGKILDLIGGYSLTWKIQHNQLHHTYTNIYGLDEDIDSIKLLRFSPIQALQSYHRYQYLYVWFFYMLMTLFWMTVKDYRQIISYRDQNLLAKYNVSFKQAVWRITLYKIFYYGYIVVLPILFSGMPWYYVIAGFLMMHFISGLFLSCVFQPAHVVETSAFAAPHHTEGKGAMENSWAIHEVENTTDFAPDNHFLTWYIGGLNYQIEHHLFTGICHVHYPKLAPIVKDVAHEFGIPYRVEPTFRKALKEHVNMLKLLGRVSNP